jgi:poly-gamma-glutamate synthesis protein (capsule biosynthesis protein)
MEIWGIKTTKIIRGWLGCLILLAMSSSCKTIPDSLPNIFSTNPGPSKTPFQPIPWTITPSPRPATPTPTPPPYSIWFDPHTPSNLREQIEIPPELGFRDNPEGTTFQLKISDSQEVSQWIYALVAPFPTVTDGVTSKEINAAWKGESPKDFKSAPLIMDESTLSVFSVLWGEPQAGSVKVIPADQILEAAWASRPSWAIIPFESLVPYWKVLEVDGLSPIRKGFEPGDYELTVPISLVGDAPVSPIIPPGNLDPDKLTTLAMTGVTALVRATAYTMERQGITYPARDIVDWLRNSDITHISNEVPFAKDCPFPNPVQQGMRFCSDTRYIELLEYVGTDIVELTGDHFSDWGSQAMVYTLELYDQRSWPYYGGGANLKDGRRALTLTHNGNRLAFIGCNAKGGGYARASPSDPGAVACDFSWMQSEITRLQEEGYLPIATFQHFEYYTYAAQPNQVRDARKLTESGAVIVSGSQAHHPQAFEFSKGGFVHHGLGNLFFDQLDVSTGTRQAFIDRHVFYNGRHISTELLTIWFVDYARPRSMTPVERETLLTAVFKASGW